MKKMKKIQIYKSECEKHELIFIKNIYEENKSEWKCIKCGKIKYKRYLNKREK
jgi:hypothetical protein